MMIALALPSSCGTRAVGQDDAARAGFQDPDEDSPRDQDDQRALKAFLEAYHLKPG